MNADTERLTALADNLDKLVEWNPLWEGRLWLYETAEALRAMISLIAEHEEIADYFYHDNPDIPAYNKHKKAESALAQWRKSDGSQGNE